MKKIILLIVIVNILSNHLFAQDKYLVYFKDKGEVTTYNDKLLLSEKTLQKRALFNIEIDTYDLPVKNEYLKVLKDNGVKVLSVSKWLNAALVETSLSKEHLLSLNSNIINVTSIKSGTKKSTAKFIDFEKQILPSYDMNKSSLQKSVIDYGAAEEQNLVFEIDYIHDKGYLGDGVTIAFLDAGYNVMDTISFFDSVFVNNRIIDTYDYWDDTTFVYHKMGHGTIVSSKIIANKPGVFVGMAPNVELIFYITDDEVTETHQDEYYLVIGLERADSIGVDIVSASIGYKDFDAGEYDYVFSDMDGNTAISTIGCNIAASKGIIVVTSAGNSGHITAPADAYGILSVGGAYLTKVYDNISSTGPTYDGRIKPDVAGISRYVKGIWVTGTIYTSSYGGTSAATPFIAGLAACLKQAYPIATSTEIIEAIKQSGHQASNPDTLIGYGVPSARIADSILAITYGMIEIKTHNDITIYPNPSSNYIFIESKNTIESIKIISIMGQVIKKVVGISNKKISLENLPKGVYIVKILDEKGLNYSKKIIIY